MAFLPNATSSGDQLFSQSNEFGRKDICFEFEQRVWCGTVDCRMAKYDGRNVLFTNVKLPNDGFIYTDDYSDPTSSRKDDIVNNMEVTSVINTILDATLPSDYDEGSLFVNYKPAEHRFELYQFNSDGSKCLTVKYEYGTYMHYVNKPSFNRRAMRLLSESSCL
jgi:hypothetical protein